MEMTDFVALVEQIVEKNSYHVELISDHATVVDAGANIGIFSIFAAVRHPGATIYAFEPTPKTVVALRENIKYYPNIKVFECALGEKTGLASLAVMPDQSAGNWIGEEGIPVDIKTIDSLNVRMDFLKMDTEGYEAPILKGAAETIRKWKPIIAMSAHHKPNDKKELPELLNSVSPYDCELRYEGGDENFICKPL
jgi:FkbM family methyltransferase